MEFAQQNIFWVVMAIVSSGLLLWNALRRDGGDLSPQAAVNLINREHGVVIDVRPATAFADSHIGGARNIPLELLVSRLPELEKSKNRPIVICGAGSEVMRAVSLLQKQGFAQAAGLDGGLKAWAEAGLPVES